MSLYLSIEPQTGHFAFCLVTNGLSFEKAGKVTGRKHLRWLSQIGQYLSLPLYLGSRASFRTVMRYLRGMQAINLFRLVLMICNANNFRRPIKYFFSVMSLIFNLR